VRARDHLGAGLNGRGVEEVQCEGPAAADAHRRRARTGDAGHGRRRAEGDECGRKTKRRGTNPRMHRIETSSAKSPRCEPCDRVPVVSRR
jgi:hypothetical protein